MNEPHKVNDVPDETAEEKEAGLTPLQVVGSVFSSTGAGGTRPAGRSMRASSSRGLPASQSSANRERDFRKGRFGIFIAAGIVFTALFVGTVYLVVSLVLSNAR